MLSGMDAPTDVGPGPTPGATPRPPAPPGGRPGPRRLRRRPDDGHIAGVCAGVAEYFNVDPVIVRIAAVVLAFSGPGVGAYILAWIFVPKAKGPVPYGARQAPIDRKDRGTQIFGIVLLGLALSVIWGDWWSPARHLFFPIGLMVLGGWLLLRRDKDDDDPESAAPPVPPAPTTADPVNADVTATVDDPSSILLDDSNSAGGGPPTAPWDVPPPPLPLPPEPPTSARRRRLLRPIVFGALLVWSGLAFLTDVSVETGLAVGLLIIGIGFVLGSFVGGSRALIVPALVVGGALVVTAVVDIPLSGPVGEQRWAPKRVADVEERYEVSLGEGTLDLSAIDLPTGERLQIDASVGIGHLVVLVPDSLVLDVDTDVGMGESEVFGLQQNGVGLATSQHDDQGATGGTLELDLRIGVGQIEARRVDPNSGDPGTGTSPTTTATTLG